MEVIYTGLRQTPEMIASAAAQEDVDVIGLSILSGAHNTLCARLMDLLRAKGMTDITVLIGGIIPEADIAGLKKAGIAEVFLPGTTTQAIVDFIRQRVAAAPRKAEETPPHLLPLRAGETQKAERRHKTSHDYSLSAKTAVGQTQRPPRAREDRRNTTDIVDSEGYAESGPQRTQRRDGGNHNTDCE